MFNFPMSPPAASNWAHEHDILFHTLTVLTVLFTGIVMFAVIFLAWRYRAGNKVDRSRPMYENLRLELSWTIAPLIMGLIFFFFSTSLFVRMKTPPKDGYEIFVIGKQWMWHAQHTNGVRENNTLHVPVGKPVKVTMISQDVLHAFYIPAFRVQMHVVPGRYTQLWFTPTKAGEYHLFCNMYCGTQHSEMGGRVVAMEPKDFANWLANNGQTVAPMTMVQAGEKVYNRVACNNCHGAQSNLRAPTLYGILGQKRVFSDGSSVNADETYLRESILRPHNRLTSGYDRSMPAYEGQLSEEEVLQLIAYVKELGSGKTPTVSGIVSPRTSPSESTGTGSKDSLSVGALQFNQERTDATPTQRGNSPSVGAYAAEGMNR
jgi:cytochrome c oxidase subunit II